MAINDAYCNDTLTAIKINMGIDMSPLFFLGLFVYNMAVCYGLMHM